MTKATILVTALIVRLSGVTAASFLLQGMRLMADSIAASAAQSRKVALQLSSPILIKE